VPGCADLASGPALEQFSKIDNQRVFGGWNVNPLAVWQARLEATYSILREQCHETKIRMRAKHDGALPPIMHDVRLLLLQK